MPTDQDPAPEEIESLRCMAEHGGLMSDYTGEALRKLIAAYERQRETLHDLAGRKIENPDSCGRNNGIIDCRCWRCVARAALGGEE